MKPTFALPLATVVLLAAACSSSPGGGTPDTSGPGGSVLIDRGGLEPLTTEPGAGTTEPGTTEPGGAGSSGSGPVGFAPASLRQFDECSSFLEYVHTEGADRVGPYGFGANGWYGGPVLAVDEGVAFEADTTFADAEAAPAEGRASGAPTTDAPAQSGGDGSFSTTNVQVEGVDEPDIVKSDGDRVLAVTGSTLTYIAIDADGATGVKRGSLRLDTVSDRYSYGHEILLAGDRAFVIAQGDGWVGTPIPEPLPLPADVVDEAETVEANEAVVDGDAESDFAPAPPVDEAPPIEIDPLPTEPYGYYAPSTLIIEVDLSDVDDLSVANVMSIEGRYVSARAIGDTARLVVTSPPEDLGFLYPSNPGTEDRAEQANQDIVRNSTVEDWVPTYTLNNNTTGPLVECEGIHAPADFAGFDMLSIVTIDLGSDLAAPTGTTAVMATGDTVYASQDRMYVSTNVWNPVIGEQSQQWLDENYETAIHRFSIAGGGPASYEASGSVEGHLLNQFSMNDRDGVFFVATTKGAPWSDSSESQIVAMERAGDRLEQVGVVDGLGRGERIFSVRYVDDTAYVVTFRQTDPFYVVDLSNPQAMTIAGELKIPGFSSYLHAIGDSLVVGVGQDATDEGRTTGTKVSLFDVSDPSNPIEVDVWTLPSASSDAEFDHRAFLYWAPTGTAVLPLQSWSEQFAGAVVLSIDADGITEQGRITHADDDGVTGQTDCRVVTAEELSPDDAGDFVWLTEQGGQLQLCGPNDQGGASNLTCDSIPVDLDLSDNDEFPFDLRGVDRIEMCWPNWDGYQVAVQRTMVIDGSLWTLSQQSIQANDLTTLDRTAAIAL